MVRSFMLVLLAAVTLVSVPDASARRLRGDGKGCNKNSQCRSGFCCNGFCSQESACCNALAGEVQCDVDLCCNTLFGEACCNDTQGFRCADTTSENNNCGSCGNQCRNGQVCRDGVCDCPDGLSACNDACVDTDTDPDNCGSCGHVCDSRTCTNGACENKCGDDRWHACTTYPTGITPCCLNGVQCCVGSRDSACCGDGTSCCTSSIGDAYCCPQGYICCGGTKSYPCVPPGSQCPE
jgi:hypothetical protein